jgi:hypothetical protein
MYGLSGTSKNERLAQISKKLNDIDVRARVSVYFNMQEGIHTFQKFKNRPRDLQVEFA